MRLSSRDMSEIEQASHRKCPRCGRHELHLGDTCFGCLSLELERSVAAQASIGAMFPSDEEIDREVLRVRAARCPRCAGPGPNDLREAPFIYSIIASTTHGRERAICCLGCGRSMAARRLIQSLLFGWWGIPNGLFRTPYYLVTGVAACCAGDGAQPSQKLRDAVHMLRWPESFSMSAGARTAASRSRR
jgi:hypothetical protein